LKTLNGITISKLKTFNAITIQVEDIQRHNYPSWMFMPKTVKCLCQRHSTAWLYPSRRHSTA
jgi:hypothetical protein